MLFREGLTRLLTEAGHEVVAQIGDARLLIEACSQVRPDLCIVDIRMPPHHGADGATPLVIYGRSSRNSRS